MRNRSRKIGVFFPSIYLPLFGYLFTRAWIGTLFASKVWTGVAETSAIAPDVLMTVFDWTLIVTYLVSAFLARRLAPLTSHRSSLGVGVGLLLVGTIIVGVSLLAQVCFGFVLMVAMVLCGVGYAVVFLLWAELYGLCNPLQVALLYSGAKILADILVFVLSDHSVVFLLPLSALLPIAGGLALFWSQRHFRSESHVPSVQWRNASFPWKPLLLMGVFGFAFGFGAADLPRVNDFASTLATDIPALLICVSVLFAWKRFDFNIVYCFALPMLIVGCFVLPLAPVPPLASSFCLRISYISILILVTVVLANLAHRYRISAMWLFGLQGFVHYASIEVGKGLQGLLAVGPVPFSAEIQAMVLGISAAVISVILISERSLFSNWSVEFVDRDDESYRESQISLAIIGVGKRYKLSPREQEILQGLVHGKTSREVAGELYVAQGTVKAHIQHIYKKLEVSSRDELIAVIDSFVG